MKKIDGKRMNMDRLAEEHYGMVYAIALAALRDRESAEELAQETFLRAILFRDSVREPAALPGWLVSVARNLARDWQRASQCRSLLVSLVPLDAEIAEVIADPGPPIYSRLAEEEQARLIREAVFRLPTELRELVLLHFLEGLPQTEIARRLGKSPTIVSRQLQLALQRLKPMIEARLGDALVSLSSSRRAREKTRVLLGFVPFASPDVLSSLREAAVSMSPDAAPGGWARLDRSERSGSDFWEAGEVCSRWVSSLRPYGGVFGVLALCGLILGFVMLYQSSRRGSSFLANALVGSLSSSQLPARSDVPVDPPETESEPRQIAQSREERLSQHRMRIEETLANSQLAEEVTSATTTRSPLAERFRRHNEESGLLSGQAAVSGIVYDVSFRRPVPSGIVEVREVQEERRENPHWRNSPHIPPGARVSISYRGTSRTLLAQADQGGRFSIERLRPGLYSFEPSPGVPGTKVWSVPDQWTDAPELHIEDRETTQIVVETFPGYTLSGQVIDKETSQPLAGAIVGLGGFHGVPATQSDAQGRFTFPGVRASLSPDSTSVSVSDVEAHLPGYVSPPRRPLVVPEKPGPFNPNDLQVSVTIELIRHRR